MLFSELWVDVSLGLVVFLLLMHFAEFVFHVRVLVFQKRLIVESDRVLVVFQKVVGLPESGVKFASPNEVFQVVVFHYLQCFVTDLNTLVIVLELNVASSLVVEVEYFGRIQFYRLVVQLQGSLEILALVLFISSVLKLFVFSLLFGRRRRRLFFLRRRDFFFHFFMMGFLMLMALFVSVLMAMLMAVTMLMAVLMAMTVLLLLFFGLLLSFLGVFLRQFVGES